MRYGVDIDRTITNDLQRQVDDLRKEIKDDVQKEIRYQYLLDVFIFGLLTTVVDKDMTVYCGLISGMCFIIFLGKVILSLYKN